MDTESAKIKQGAKERKAWEKFCLKEEKKERKQIEKELKKIEKEKRRHVKRDEKRRQSKEYLRNECQLRDDDLKRTLQLTDIMLTRIKEFPGATTAGTNNENAVETFGSIETNLKKFETEYNTLKLMYEQKNLEVQEMKEKKNESIENEENIVVLRESDERKTDDLNNNQASNGVFTNKLNRLSTTSQNLNDNMHQPLISNIISLYTSITSVKPYANQEDVYNSNFFENKIDTKEIVEEYQKKIHALEIENLKLMVHDKNRKGQYEFRQKTDQVKGDIKKLEDLIFGVVTPSVILGKVNEVIRNFENNMDELLVEFQRNLKVYDVVSSSGKIDHDVIHQRAREKYEELIHLTANENERLKALLDAE